MTARELHRMADLISKAAVYHAVKIVRHGEIRPPAEVVRINRLWKPTEVRND